MITNWTNFWKIEDNAMVHTDKADDITTFIALDEKICWAREADIVAMMFNPIRNVVFVVERYSIPEMDILEYDVDEYKIDDTECAYMQGTTIKFKREECAIMAATCLLCDDLIVKK